MLRNNKNYIYFTASQCISQIGDFVHWVTVLALVYTSTQSGVAIASVPIVIAGTRLIFGSFAGVVVDKFERKKLMFLTNLGQGILVPFFIFSLQLGGLIQIIYILLLTLLISILSTLHEPTQQSIIPMIVRRSEILKANSTLETLMNAVWVMGPLLGGGLVTFIGYGAGFVFNSLTFFGSAFLIIPFNLPKISKNEKPFFREFKEGFGYLRKKKLILLLTVSTFVMMLGAGGVNALMAAVPKDVFGVDTGFGYPIFLSAVGIGWIMGSSLLAKFSSKLRSKHDKLKVWFFMRILSGATIIGVVHATTFQLAIAIWLIHGLFNSLHDSTEITLVQEEAGKNLTGRIFGIKGSLEESASILSMGICGIIYEFYDIIISFTYSGLLEIASAFVILSFFFYKLRNRI